jgi:hypothetical protein
MRWAGHAARNGGKRGIHIGKITPLSQCASELYRTIFFPKLNYNNQVEEHEMGGACSMDGREDKRM